MSHSNRKAIAGYHMLMILAAVDGEINKKEDHIIKAYLEENLKGLPSLENEMRVIRALPSADYAVHFNNSMNQFYLHSTKAERNHFLDMATRLVAADKEISQRENLFLNELFNAWEEEIED